MEANLSGFPDLIVTFANPSILNDVRFHPCIRFRPWEANQILSFVPPNGRFKLMNYRYDLNHHYEIINICFAVIFTFQSLMTV